MRKLAGFAVFAVLVVFLVSQMAPTTALWGIKGSSFPIASGSTLKYLPIIAGDAVAWAEYDPENPGYVIKYKDLKKGDVVVLSDNPDYWIYAPWGRNGGMYMTDKFCYWMAREYEGGRLIICLYDLQRDREIRIREDKAHSWMPAMDGNTLVYQRYGFDCDAWKWQRQVMVKNVHSNKDAEAVYTFEKWPRSLVASNGYATWDDNGKIYLLDINKGLATYVTGSDMEMCFSPIVQGDHLFYTRLNSLNQYTIYGYNIKDKVHFKVYDGNMDLNQYARFNPESDHLVFILESGDTTTWGAKLYRIMLYDNKTGEIKEIPTSGYCWLRNQSAYKEYVVWNEYNFSARRWEVKLYDNKDSSITVLSYNCRPEWYPTIDKHVAVWVDLTAGWYNGTIMGFKITGNVEKKK
ncbi:MAG TPA: hypothetical protein PKV16_08325 [Caldisericia bacterium]|nr:hypothetical protein [Caldisericia bacterium]HPF49782.1 hypothetical protein [Caldisericia bacterium]HPI84343.1 hypothetical protein [Caldisericia bacterium]HPQ93770.1 hypothetical protein [Caldisericia bacterium]HRV74806.1 hypothetical protein [Caldisericia bacterium]